MIARDRNWLLAFAACALLVAVYPFFADGYQLTVVRDALIFGLFAASLDFFWGRTGILCFGHAAFFGIGGYIMALVTMADGVPARACSVSSARSAARRFWRSSSDTSCSSAASVAAISPSSRWRWASSSSRRDLVEFRHRRRQRPDRHSHDRRRPRGTAARSRAGSRQLCLRRASRRYHRPRALAHQSKPWASC